ncbi:MAG: 1-(5-phosphoribosyl)-5-[(5-phosphoribosylamino)methylideneamino]imidazole-4-carboxamide isomerase [Syntrophales bacterium]|nr:1-(5-phosphoribosyl)-5-[(5-phosphoribosylamino)methylideneamino]imidazole-4-carboxamide isomerase [Syntrophales bacterium]
MIVIPAIDLKDGRCVRLSQGDFSRVTIYDSDPVSVAKKWQEEGAERIHVVDLDGSLAGQPRNFNAIYRITTHLNIPIEVGGGIRDLETIETYLSLGVKWVILGTAAVKDESLLLKAAERYSGRIILALDALDGHITVQGWTEKTGLPAVEIAKRYENAGIAAIIYTDVSRDGMKTGLNLEQTCRLAEAVNVPVIASGGLKDLSDIEKLMEFEDKGIMGVIVGRALYTGDLCLPEAIKLTKKERKEVSYDG